MASTTQPESKILKNTEAEHVIDINEPFNQTRHKDESNQPLQATPSYASPIEKATWYMRQIALFDCVDTEISARLERLSKSHKAQFKTFGQLEQIEKALTYAIYALFLTPEDHLDLLSRLENLGDIHTTRFEQLGNDDDIDQSIRCYSRARLLMSEDHPGLPRLLGSLGVSHGDRFTKLGDRRDLESALSFHSRAFSLVEEGHLEFTRLLRYLGMSHGIRFELLGDPSDLEIAIDSHSRALSLMPEGHSELPILLGNLGTSYIQHFRISRDLKDVESAILHQSRGLSLLPEGHPDLTVLLGLLGASHGIRSQILQSLNDLEIAIDLHSRGLSLAPDGHLARPKLLSSLGVSYTTRFGVLQDPKDMEYGLYLLNCALPLVTNHSELAMLLQTLGRTYALRAVRLGQLSDVEKVIEYLSRAVSMTPVGHPSLPDQLERLGMAYGMRLQRLGEINDAKLSIECLTQAVTIVPEDHPGLSMILDTLGISHREVFYRLGILEDLDKAIDYHSRAVSLTSEGDYIYPRRLSVLGASYQERFLRLNKLDDNENAIKYLSRALSLAPKGYIELPRTLEALGSSHLERFQRLAELDDIDKAVEYHFRAYSLTERDHAELPGRLDNLSRSHRVRFRRLDELDDIEKAIVYLSHALSLTPDGHIGASKRLKDLGVSHMDRFEHTKAVSDLNKAIDYTLHALSQTPEGHPSLPELFQSLGTAYKGRFERLGEIGDLDKAIENHSQATSLTPNDHPELARRLGNLGSAHRDRFRSLEIFYDLEKSIEYHYRSLRLTPENHPSLVDHLINLGMSLTEKYKHLNETSDLQDSLACFRRASESLVGAPRSKFTAALTWARHASTHNHPDCIRAYQTAIDLLPQVVWMGSTTTQRYHDLQLTNDLAVEAASVAFSAANYNLALTWLEHARCIVWNQTLLLRTPFDELHSSYPSMAERLQKCTVELEKISVEPRRMALDPLSPDAADLEANAHQHRRLAIERDALLSEIRKLPGFEDFLLPKNAVELTRAARNGPVAVINCSKRHSHALVIVPGRNDIIPIPLPAFTHENAELARAKIVVSLRDKGIRERGVKIRQEPGQEERFQEVLKMLWNDVVKPILDSLGYMNSAPMDNIPHITWCPTGIASFLPFHAAGDYGHPHARVFNYVVSSYTPTLTALLSASPRCLTSDSRILGIGQEATPGYQPLPGIVRELEYIKGHMQNVADYSELMNDKATRDTVLEAMEHHDWVHLACHANQDVGDPTKSGFLLHDGRLDLATITRRSFKNKGLAFLSACQTATGDERLPDEAVHLASGMIIAGYPSVVGTLWSVSDSDAPLVADQIYRHIVKIKKVGSGEVGRALHSAVGALREGIGEKEFIRWVPYIHIGS
ncbi:hypothetical protein RhiTH_002540 [Rhizoctonia solani]